MSDLYLESVYPKVVGIVRSPTNQAATLPAIVALLQHLISSPATAKCFQFKVVFADLYSTTSTSVLQNTTSLSNLSKCVAGISRATTSFDQQKEVVALFVSDLSSDSYATRELALLCVAEVGRFSAKLTESHPDLREKVVRCLDSQNEEVQLAAATCLGRIAAGNMTQFLPTLLGAPHRYLLWCAVKEMLLVLGDAEGLGHLGTHLEGVLEALLRQCRPLQNDNNNSDTNDNNTSNNTTDNINTSITNSTDDSVKNIVAECLGVLVSMLPNRVVHVLLDDSVDRKMMLNSLRFSLSRSLMHRKSDAESVVVIGEAMEKILLLLLDHDDLETRRCCLLLINTALHHHPSCIYKHVHNLVVPKLMATLQIRLERSVDLGPFKHRVDDNLPSRKACMTCIETILEVMPEQFDTTSFLSITPLLLTDKNEIKLQTYLVLAKISSVNPTALLAVIDQLIDPLEKSVGKKTSSSNTSSLVGPELERAQEGLKSVVRLVVELQHGVDLLSGNRRWKEFVDRLKLLEDVPSMFLSVEAERDGRRREV